MFSPEGLWLTTPATLDIVVEETTDDATVPLVLEGDAGASEAYLGRRVAATTLAVDHFSGGMSVRPVGGAPVVNPAEWTPINALTRTHQALNRLENLQFDSRASVVAGYWRSIHEVNIVPLLVEATERAQRIETTADAVWLAAILFIVGRWADWESNDEWTQADRDLAESVRQQLLDILRVAVAAALQRCNDRHDLEALAFLWIWQDTLRRALPADPAALKSCLSFELRFHSTTEVRLGDFIRVGLDGRVPLTVELDLEGEWRGTAFTFNGGAGPLRYVEASSSEFEAIGPCGQPGRVVSGNDTTMIVPKWQLEYSLAATPAGGLGRFAFTEAVVEYELGDPTENVRMCDGTYQFDPGLFKQWYTDLHSLEQLSGSSFTEMHWTGAATPGGVIGTATYQRTETVSFLLHATFPGDEADTVSAPVEEDTVLELVHGGG